MRVWRDWFLFIFLPFWNGVSNESIFNIIENFELSYLVADNLNWNRISIGIGKKILSTVHEYEIPHAAKQFSLIQVINATTSDVTCQAWVTRAFANPNPNRDESNQKKTNKPGKQQHNCKLDFCVKWISYMIFDGMSAFDLLHECNTTSQCKCGAI